MAKSMPLYLKDGLPLWIASDQLNTSSGFAGFALLLSSDTKRRAYVC